LGLQDVDSASPMEGASFPWPSQPSESDGKRFLQLLKPYGLLPIETVVLLDKFVTGLTEVQIYEKRGLTSPGICHYVYRRALAKLELAGFTLDQDLRFK
jgi:hypothetical protein